MPLSRLAVFAFAALAAVAAPNASQAQQPVYGVTQAPYQTGSAQSAIQRQVISAPQPVQAAAYQHVPQRVPVQDVQLIPIQSGVHNAAHFVAQPAPLSAPRRITPGYPYLNAPLYPVPRPDVPYQVGGTFITNQALAPQEMLYPHTYKAMYPPYYYRVHGKWHLTPHGIHSCEHWELQGTTVKVKYSPHISIFSGFRPVRKR